MIDVESNRILFVLPPAFDHLALTHWTMQGLTTSSLLHDHGADALSVEIVETEEGDGVFLGYIKEADAARLGVDAVGELLH